MIQWRDEGILLSVKPFGENSVIAELFAENQGRYAGVIRGGTSRKLAPILQPGAQLQADWKARLSEHLGSLSVELVRSRTAQAMFGRLALAGLNAVCGLLSLVLPEREPHHDLYVQTERLLDRKRIQQTGERARRCRGKTDYRHSAAQPGKGC